MIKAVNKKGAELEPIAEGSYPARIYQILHIGTYPDYVGVLKDKVMITFELPTEMHVFDKEKGEQPRVISTEYTLSFHEKATLTKVIKACDPQAMKLDENGLTDFYDVEKLIGKTCLVSIIHKKGKDDNIYANVGGVTMIPKGMTCDPAINPPVVLNYDNWNEEVFTKLPSFIQKRIMSSTEFQVMKGLITPELDGDVPF